jgi:NADH pyrophosphatase NudC (nudix superfamily)
MHEAGGPQASTGKVARVGIAAHIARLRAVVGHELLLLPSISVLPVDDAGRVLLVRHAGHDDGWGVLGGAVDIGESPPEAAVREAREELSDVAWFTREELARLRLSRFSRALLSATGLL